jgi:hypothetical protein
MDAKELSIFDTAPFDEPNASPIALPRRRNQADRGEAKRPPPDYAPGVEHLFTIRPLPYPRPLAIPSSADSGHQNTRTKFRTDRPAGGMRRLYAPPLRAPWRHLQARKALPLSRIAGGPSIPWFAALAAVSIPSGNFGCS